MTMTLLFSGTSPYVRKVDVLLREAGIHEQINYRAASGTPFDPNENAVAANPLGKVPALLREDGPAIYDSRVICRFIDSLVEQQFYPETRLFEVLTLEATADGMLDAALLMVYEGRLRPEDKQHAPFVDAQWLKIDRSLDAIENRWMSHLQGPLTMGQIAVGCALGYLDLRHENRNWRDGRPALATWFAAFEDRPSMQATLPSG